MKYLIVIKETQTGFSAYSPDIDGCVAAGKTKKEVRKNLKGAIEFHLEGLDIEHLLYLNRNTYSNYLEITPANLATLAIKF